MPRQIALLRGINLGPNRRVSMPELREVLTEAGYADVQTLLQSGNVVLTSTAKPAKLTRDLEALIEERLGVAAPVIVRSRDELAAVVEHDPLGDVADDPKRHVVYFLDGEPAKDVVRQLEAEDVAPEAVAFAGREIHTWHPDGIQRSPLVKLLTDKRLGVTYTARNWNTVTKLLALADG
jgi:uncharacterized protein (DUF1697 family)